MTSNSKLAPMSQEEFFAYGQARLRDISFDAFQELWLKRKAEGMQQSELAEILGRDPAWVSRTLRGPGNWTFKTFGALVAALNGDVEMSVHAVEDAPETPSNYHSYDDFSRPKSRFLSDPASSSSNSEHISVSA